MSALTRLLQRRDKTSPGGSRTPTANRGKDGEARTSAATAPPGVDLPELTRSQKATLDALSLSYDTVTGRVRRNGVLEVRCESHDDGSRYINYVDVAQDGCPYDVYEERETA